MRPAIAGSIFIRGNLSVCVSVCVSVCRSRIWSRFRFCSLYTALGAVNHMWDVGCCYELVFVSERSELTSAVSSLPPSLPQLHQPSPSLYLGERVWGYLHVKGAVLCGCDSLSPLYQGERVCGYLLVKGPGCAGLTGRGGGTFAGQRRHCGQAERESGQAGDLCGPGRGPGLPSAPLAPRLDSAIAIRIHHHLPDSVSLGEVLTQ